MKENKSLPAADTAANNEDDLDLKSLREAKGVSLKDIFAATRIITAHLEAIEMGRYESLPEPVYTRTFIKTYARFLGIDSAPLLQRYEGYLQNLPHPSPAGPDKETTREEMKTKKMSRKLIFSIILVILLIGLIAVIVLFESLGGNHRSLPPQSSPPQGDTGGAVDGPPLPAPPPGRQTSATNAVPTPGQPVTTLPGKSLPEQAVPGPSLPIPPQTLNVKIEATERTWVRIVADQGQPEQLTLAAGDNLERAARESFSIVIGNAGGAKVWFQGRPLPELGKRGEVKHLKFP